MDTMPIGWVDLTLLAVLAVSVAVGLWRGFVFEVFALLGWIVAWFAAPYLSVHIAPHLPIGTPGSTLNVGAAFAIGFVAVLVVWMLCARLIRLLIRATPLSAIDRLLGGVFGALRGAVLLLAAALLIGLTPVAQAQAWQQSHGAHWLRAGLAELRGLLPASLSQHLPSARA